jgi:hypothetical protein
LSLELKYFDGLVVLLEAEPVRAFPEAPAADVQTVGTDHTPALLADATPSLE